ncbi:anaphase-promoting complex subunit 3 [Nematocida sp. AWRm77]|nr:anaphase-promoting complex subunit 3 [Nematocida sp. AWRm77]
MITTEEFLCRCIKYHRFKDAIYVVETYPDVQKKASSVLLGYLFMRNGEYRRAISYLGQSVSFTSSYYQALCYKELKDYRNAKFVLTKAKESKELKESKERGVCPERTSLEKLYLLEEDASFVSALLGDLDILAGSYETAVGSYYAACKENPMHRTGHLTVLEDTLAQAKTCHNNEENVNNVFVSSEKRFTNISSEELDEVIKDHIANKEDKCTPGQISVMQSLLQESMYLEQIRKGNCAFAESKKLLDTLPLSTVTVLGIALFEAGFLQKAERVFGYVRVKDPCSLEGMHYYSSILWQNRDKPLLGCLSRDLFGVNPHSHVSWGVLGNYFSLVKETEKAAQCFERSLAIKKDSYVMCLLGHEHFMNSNLTESLRCFIGSMQMKASHYSGVAGCGLIYEKIGKKDSAEYCFLKAVAHNPQNVLLGYLAAKFLISQKKFIQGLGLIQKYLGFQDTVTEIAAKIEEDAWETYLFSLPSSAHEQVVPLRSAFSLEIASVLAHSGYPQAAEVLANSTTGKGQSFLARKTDLLHTIGVISKCKTESISE